MSFDFSHTLGATACCLIYRVTYSHAPEFYGPFIWHAAPALPLSFHGRGRSL